MTVSLEQLQIISQGSSLSSTKDIVFTQGNNSLVCLLQAVKHKKLFLARHSNRKLTNTEEIEAYFREQGFYFVEGFELSLEEKVDIFYHAEIIVGLHSSAWQNIIFCNNVFFYIIKKSFDFSSVTIFYFIISPHNKKWKQYFI